MPHKPFHRANVKKTENIKTKMGQKRRSALEINQDKKY